jgi:hypothetical protein
LVGESRRYGAGLFPSHLNFRELQAVYGAPINYGWIETGSIRVSRKTLRED